MTLSAAYVKTQFDAIKETRLDWITVMLKAAFVEYDRSLIVRRH